MKLGTQLQDALRAAGLRPPADAEGKRTGKLGGQTGRRNGVVPAKPGQVSVPSSWSDESSLVRLGVPISNPTPAKTPDRRFELVARGPDRSRDGQAKRPTASQVSRASVVPQASPKSRSTLVQIGLFHPHGLFAEDPSDEAPLPQLANDGVDGSMTADPENETDLILGLDFGTSSTKVVIRDAFAATSVFPVNLSGQRRGIDGFLLPSRVFKTADVYSLSGGTHRISNLKLGLLECPARSPVTEFNDCCAFLALVIRRARAWLFTEHRDVYARHAVNWRVNLGLAARSYEDKTVVDLFRRLAWAAANLASDSEARQITTSQVESWRRRSLDVLAGRDRVVDGRAAFAWDEVDAVPEVSAQLQGFMKSARWDWRSRPVMMLVDVGAGTVDTAMFHVRVPSEADGVLTFYSSRVEPNGSMNLHRARVDLLKQLVPEGEIHWPTRDYLCSIERPTDRLRPIPESIGDYLPGYELQTTGIDPDEAFRRAGFRRQVVGCINDAKISKGIGIYQLSGVPLLLCGGGSRMGFYGSVGEVINSTPGWNVSVEVLRLPVPQDLADSGWHTDGFDRLSVAYGLSLSGEGGATLGTIVRATEVPDVQRYSARSEDDRFVSKDQV
ncbi:hypothetical protein [Cupriavidus sp. IDO]|uniref:hypothetical protein n=1 Tax=Cupriavidus sp. IDO TaxID=1539142 RepID=UPI000AC59584|nr:hypothetical protein [Cupriavidus sp. IDO]